MGIGCADGYYAVGSARLWSEAEVIAFGLDSVARNATRTHARFNKVEARLSVRNRATPENICQTLGDCSASLLIVDCEGAEVKLISPTDIPELRRAYLLIELHPNVLSNIEKVMIERLQKKHDVEVLYPEQKTSDRYCGRSRFRKFSNVDLDLAVNEHRSFAPWLLAQPLVSE